MVGFAVRPTDASDGVATRNNIGSFVASRRGRSKVDDKAHEARVIAGKRGGFRPVDQCGRIPSNRHRHQQTMDPKGVRKHDRRTRRRELVAG